MDIDMQLRQFIDEYDAWLREKIATYGWAIQHVGPREDGAAQFAYTVGLTTFGHPELVVAGLCGCETGPVLNTFGDQVRAGVVFADGAEFRLDAFPAARFACRAVTPELSEATLLAANGLYREADGPPVPALQVFWSDEGHRLPWEEGWCLDPDEQTLRSPR